jgi:hypothetical protein
MIVNSVGTAAMGLAVTLRKRNRRRTIFFKYRGPVSTVGREDCNARLLAERRENVGSQIKQTCLRVTPRTSHSLALACEAMRHKAQVGRVRWRWPMIHITAARTSSNKYILASIQQTSTSYYFKSMRRPVSKFPCLPLAENASFAFQLNVATC